MIRVVLFDFDGVIVDSSKDIAEAVNKTFMVAVQHVKSEYDVLDPYIKNLARNILKEQKDSIIDIPHNLKRCGLGTTLSSIGYDGKIYGCQEQTSKTEKNIFLIGDIFSGINVNQHKNLLKTYYDGPRPKCKNEDLCLNCSHFCEGNTCPSTNLDINNNFFQRTEIVCLFDQYIYNNCLILLNKYKDKNSNSFYNYLEKSCNYKIRKEE